MSGTTASKRVFLTGATGTMGRAALRELVDRADRLEVVALVLPTPHDRQAIAEFRDARNLTVVFGDVTRFAGVRRCYERHWFATRNFHGHWFTDSDRIDELVPFRTGTFDDALGRAVATAPAKLWLAGRVPPSVVKRCVIEPLTRRDRGTMHWIQSDDEERVRAYFGSRAQWELIGDWSTFEPPRPARTPTYLDLGFDESHDLSTWRPADLAAAADHRGGSLVSQVLASTDVSTPLSWRCADGHTFTGGPRLVLLAGHWCPVCVARPDDFGRQSESNTFLRQVV